MSEYSQTEKMPQVPQGLRSGLIPACDKAAEHPSMPVFREYCEVKSEFDRLCRNIAAAQQGKANAEKHLLELSAKIQAMVEDGQYDPTVPRGANADPSAKAYAGHASRY